MNKGALHLRKFTNLTPLEIDIKLVLHITILIIHSFSPLTDGKVLYGSIL